MTGLTCRHFGICGGCSLLDQPHGDQLRDKVERVAAMLAPFCADVRPTWDTAPKPPRYDRIDLLYPIHPHPDGLTMGLYRRGSHRVVELDECRLQAPALTTLGQRALQILRESGIPPYREGTHKGILRAFRARYMPGTGELLAGVVTTTGAVRGLPGVADALRDAAADLRDPGGQPLRLVGFVRHHNPAQGNALMGSGEGDEAVRGRPFQWDEVRLGGLRLRLRVSFASFYQSNRHASRLLYEPALDLLGDVAGCTVVDGYGGVGAFGVRLLARGASRVWVVESHPSSAADAVANAIATGGAGLEVLAEPFPTAAWPAAPDVMVVDPPRAGLMDEGVAAVLASAPRRLLYVACAPKALVRDLPPLLAGGYTVRGLHVADLFPHTDHVEVLALLQRGP